MTQNQFGFLIMDDRQKNPEILAIADSGKISSIKLIFKETSGSRHVNLKEIDPPTL